MEWNLTNKRIYEIEQELIRRCDLYIDNWPMESFSFFTSYKKFDHYLGMYKQCPLRDWMLYNEWMPYISWEYHETEYMLLSHSIYEHYKNQFIYLKLNQNP